MKRQLWILLLVSLGVVLPLRAEVVIFAEPATGIVVQGPLSIIEDPDPVPNYWIGSSPAEMHAWPNLANSQSAHSKMA